MVNKEPTEKMTSGKFRALGFGVSDAWPDNTLNPYLPERRVGYVPVTGIRNV